MNTQSITTVAAILLAALAFGFVFRFHLAALWQWARKELAFNGQIGGYVHNKSMYVWIPFTKFAHSAGTWTATVAANVWFARRTAADAAATTYIPIDPGPVDPVAQHGVQLKSVQVHFRVVTAALDALEAHLYKATLGADGALLTVAEVTTTYDTGHDAAAERIDVDEHLMTLTLTTPEWIDGDGSYYFIEVVADAAATSLLDYFGALASIELRL